MSKTITAVMETVNTPYREKRSAKQLAQMITDPASAANCNATVFAFFSEVAPALQLAFMNEMNVDAEKAEAVEKLFAKMAGGADPLGTG